MPEGKKQYFENPAPERKAHVYTGPKDKVQEDGLKVKEVIIDEGLATQETDAASVAISELVETECKHDELKSCVDCPEPAGTCPLSPVVKDKQEEAIVEKPVGEPVAMLTVFNCVQVNLRNSPQDGLKIIGQLSCDTEVLEMDSDESNDLYVKVCTASGIEGFVQRAYVKG